MDKCAEFVNEIAEAGKNQLDSINLIDESLKQLNQSIQAQDEKTSADKNSDEELNTPEDIMEKYIWTIRALEDEWAKFTNSEEYRDLPNQTKDSKKKFYRQVDEPSPRILAATAAYRRSMNYLTA